MDDHINVCRNFLQYFNCSAAKSKDGLIETFVSFVPKNLEGTLKLKIEISVKKLGSVSEIQK